MGNPSTLLALTGAFTPIAVTVCCMTPGNHACWGVGALLTSQANSVVERASSVQGVGHGDGAGTRPGCAEEDLEDFVAGALSGALPPPAGQCSVKRSDRCRTVAPPCLWFRVACVGWIARQVAFLV